MAKLYRKPYVESSVFISLIADEVTNGIERGRISAKVFSYAESGDFSIYTSTLTIAEVYKQKGNPMGTLTEAQSGQILELFEHEYIKLIDIDRRIAEEAHKLSRQFGLSPNDAIHLASSLKAKCDILLSWDVNSFISKVQMSEIVVEEPAIPTKEQLSMLTDSLS